MKVRDVLTAEPMPLTSIAMALSKDVPPWMPLTPLDDIRRELAELVSCNAAVRISLPYGHGWRRVGAT